MSVNYQVETGFQLFARLNIRPSLDNVYPHIFSSFGPKGREVVEILGDTSTGKTLLITEIVAISLLPVSKNNIEINGKDAGVIVINTDHHFHIFKLKSTMECILQKYKNSFNTVEINEIINESLKKLIILNCFDSHQLFVTIYNLENIISSNNKLSLIVLDSLSAYYWADRLNGGIKKMNVYQKNILKLLQNMTKDYNLVIMFTKYSAFCTKKELKEECYKQPTLEKINYRIFLEKCINEEKYMAHIIYPDNTKSSKAYKISDTIQWIDM